MNRGAIILILGNVCAATWASLATLQCQNGSQAKNLYLVVAGM